jgi:hypothetical protein
VVGVRVRDGMKGRGGRDGEEEEADEGESGAVGESCIMEGKSGNTYVYAREVNE